MGNHIRSCCNNKDTNQISINILPETDRRMTYTRNQTKKNSERELHFSEGENPISFAINRNRLLSQMSFDQSTLIQSTDHKIGDDLKYHSVQDFKLPLIERIHILEKQLVHLPRLKVNPSSCSVATTGSVLQSPFSSDLRVTKRKDFEVLNQPLTEGQIEFLKKTLFNEELLLKEMTESIM